jgi:uncharacterized RDD family membrane protein YckC
VAPPYPAVPPPGWTPPPYAHWGRRACAALLDLLLVLPANVLAIVGFILLVGNISTDPVTDELSVDSGALAGIALMTTGYLAAFAFQIWNSIFRQGRTGASLGKQWMAIEVLSEENGRPIGALMTFVRQMVHIVDSLPCYAGYLWPLWDEKRQTFADKFMKTMVLDRPKQDGAAPQS